MQDPSQRVSDRVPASPSSQAAFERYVLPEIEVLLRVGRLLTRNAADAEDLVQDTLLRAYRAIDRFDGRHPRAWLLTILRNTHVNRNRRRRPELIRHADAAATVAAVPSGDVTEDFVERQFGAAVDAALTALSEPFRQTVALVDIDGLSYAEAAAVLGVPPGTIMSRLHRGRARIREHLATVGAAPHFEEGTA